MAETMSGLYRHGTVRDPARQSCVRFLALSGPSHDPDTIVSSLTDERLASG